MHILILEACLTGHHANYLEHIATTFLEQGHRLTISVPQEYFDNSLFARLQAGRPGRIAIEATPSLPAWACLFGSLGVVGSELSHWLMFKRCFEQLSIKHHVEYVFIPYLDYCLHAAALLGSPFGSVIWSGICMRPSFHYGDVGVIAPKPKWSAIKERLFYRLLRQPSLQKLLTIDELLEQYVRQKRPLSAQKLAFVPDPAELTNEYDRTTARHKFNISKQDYVILVYGAIDGRKGIEYLLDATLDLRFLKKLTILVVGMHTQALRDKLHRYPRVISIDKYVDPATEEAAFRSADAVWIGYRAHYVMSGVLILAAMSAKPVLASRNGLIGWMTRRYDLGIIIDCENRIDVKNAIFTLMKIPPTDQPNSGMNIIRERHTWTEFKRALLRDLSKKKPGSEEADSSKSATRFRDS